MAWVGGSRVNGPGPCVGWVHDVFMEKSKAEIVKLTYPKRSPKPRHKALTLSCKLTQISWVCHWLLTCL